MEVSEEEFKEEDEDDSIVEIQEMERPADVHEDETKKKEEPEESSTEAQAAALESDEERQDEEDERKEPEASSTPAVNEWDHMDMVGISVIFINRKSATNMIICNCCR